MRIDEVSEEESYKFSYMSSSLLKKVWEKWQQHSNTNTNNLTVCQVMTLLI